MVVEIMKKLVVDGESGVGIGGGRRWRRRRCGGGLGGLVAGLGCWGGGRPEFGCQSWAGSYRREGGRWA